MGGSKCLVLLFGVKRKGDKHAGWSCLVLPGFEALLITRQIQEELFPPLTVSDLPSPWQTVAVGSGRRPACNAPQQR